MSPDDYLQNRVDDQIAWYDRKSLRAQRWFKRLRSLEIVAAGAIPLFAGYGAGAGWSLIVSGVLGALVAVLAALLGLYQFQENWIAYRSACESLKHEKFLYLTAAPPYDGDTPFGLFVQRIENLISRENSAWSEQIHSGAATGTGRETR